MPLPKKIIAGMSVRDYAYQWIDGGCLIHQWVSGGRGIDTDVVAFAKSELTKIEANVTDPNGWRSTGWTKLDLTQFAELVGYLADNLGAPAETYTPDQWN